MERNVLYNVMGGAIFIEDGIETNNVIQYNLAVFVKQSTSLLNDDITPGKILKFQIYFSFFYTVVAKAIQELSIDFIISKIHLLIQLVKY